MTQERLHKMLKAALVYGRSNAYSPVCFYLGKTGFCGQDAVEHSEYTDHTYVGLYELIIEVSGGIDEGGGE